MTDINDIINDNWDINICAKPDIIDDTKTSRRGYGRVVSTRRTTTIDDIEGIVERRFFNPDSYDAWITWIISSKNSVVSDPEDDVENMIKAIKKICSTFTPTGDENILEWEGGDWKPFNNVRYQFKFVLLKRKGGMQAY